MDGARLAAGLALSWWNSLILILFISICIETTKAMSMRASTTSFELGPGLTLVGRSRAGDGTSFAIPGVKWLFDCGALVHGQEPSHIFITHTHADHTTFLSNYVENEYKKAPPIYVPHEALPFVKAYLEAHYAMTQMTIEAAKPLDLSCLHPVTPGEEFRIKSKGGDDFFVTPILADHRVTCYGYSFVRLKRKLKDEYTKLNGRELGKLRKEGVNIYETVREPAFCYIGDSTTKVFDMNPEILRQHSVVVTECSFIAEKDVKRAEETQHTHWNHLKPIVESNPNTLFVLIHFTLKHSALSFLEFFNKETGDKHRNVHPMLVEHEVNGEWRKRKKNNHKGNAPNCMCFRCSP